MKTVIRTGVFETASSSVHSMVLCDEETYKKWSEGEVLYDGERGKDGFDVFKSYDEVRKEIINDIMEYDRKHDHKYNTETDIPEVEIEDWLFDEYKTLEQWSEDEYLEYDENEFTVDGKKYYAICKHGYNG